MIGVSPCFFVRFRVKGAVDLRRRHSVVFNFQSCHLLTSNVERVRLFPCSSSSLYIRRRGRLSYRNGRLPLQSSVKHGPRPNFLDINFAKHCSSTISGGTPTRSFLLRASSLFHSRPRTPSNPFVLRVASERPVVLDPSNQRPCPSCSAYVPTSYQFNPSSYWARDSVILVGCRSHHHPENR